MNIIVTGGAGFIGSHLVELLLEKGHDVTVLDNFSTGNFEHISRVLKEENYGSVDITNYRQLLYTFEISSQSAPVDVVFHLAAKAAIVPSIKDPFLYHDTNVTGTLNVLECARRCGAKKIIYAASGSCYGIPEQVPTSETCKTDPQYPYALTKYVAEQYAQHWSKVYGIPFVSLRLFNVFGPRMCLSGGYGGLFSAVLPQKFNHAPVVTIGDGKQRRDFVYVTDVARAFLAAAESDVQNEILNIGSGNSISVNRILQLLEIPEGNIKRMPDRPGEPKNTVANIQKANRMLKWRPKVPLIDGLTMMTEDVEYWKNGRVYTYEESLESQKEWYQYLGHKSK